jgi:YggT family protein
VSPVGAGINLALSIFIGLVLARIVTEMVQSFARSWEPRGIVMVLLEIVFTITDPPILAFRRVFGSDPNHLQPLVSIGEPRHLDRAASG